jgi:hypothetical protein
LLESRAGDAAIRHFDALFRQARILIEPVTEEQALLARQGYSDYGKGRMLLVSTSVTVSPTPWQGQPANHSSSKARISAKPTSSPPCHSSPARVLETFSMTGCYPFGMMTPVVNYIWSAGALLPLFF